MKSVCNATFKQVWWVYVQTIGRFQELGHACLVAMVATSAFDNLHCHTAPRLSLLSLSGHYRLASASPSRLFIIFALHLVEHSALHLLTSNWP
jgi:hypothetical protein